MWIQFEKGCGLDVDQSRMPKSSKPSLPITVQELLCRFVGGTKFGSKSKMKHANQPAHKVYLRSFCACSCLAHCSKATQLGILGAQSITTILQVHGEHRRIESTAFQGRDDAESSLVYTIIVQAIVPTKILFLPLLNFLNVESLHESSKCQKSVGHVWVANCFDDLRGLVFQQPHLRIRLCNVQLDGHSACSLPKKRHPHLILSINHWDNFQAFYLKLAFTYVWLILQPKRRVAN